MPVAGLLGELDVYLRRGEALFKYGLDVDFVAADIELLKFAAKNLRRQSCGDDGPEDHVTAGSTEAVEIGDAHADPRTTDVYSTTTAPEILRSELKKLN